MKVLQNLGRKLEEHSIFIIIVWIIVLSIFYSTLSLLRHSHFQSGAFDLGIYDLAVWQYSTFQFPYNTIKQRFILGDHLTLTLPLLVPLYWIWDDVRMLLIFQAFFICLSAFPLYLVSIKRGFSHFVSLIISIIYSLFYGIQFAVFFDFHPILIGIGLLPWIVYSIETQRKKLLLIFLTIALLTQENMGIAIAGIGFIYIFKKYYRKIALFFIFFGISVSLLAVRLTSYFSPIGFEYTPMLTLDPIKNFFLFFDSFEKREVWFYSMSWFSFLPLLSPGALVAVAVDLAQYFLTGPAFIRMWSPYTHHRAILSVFLTLGTLDALEIFKKRKINLAVIVLCMVFIIVLLQYKFHFPLNKLSKTEYWKKEKWMDDNKALFATFSRDMKIASSQNLIPHISHRNKIYLIYPRRLDLSKELCEERHCWWLDFPKEAEYLVLDMRPNQWLTQLLETNEHFTEAVRNMEKTKKIRLQREIGDARLYKIVNKY